MTRFSVRLMSLVALTASTCAFAQELARPGDEPSAIEQEKPTSPEESWRPIMRGQLPNGLRYVILPRTSAEPGVAIRIRVKGGFLAEHRPGERGLAHLIEHLAFASSTRSAPDQIRRFRQVGFPLSLPSPAGGTTTWRESDYFVVSRTNQTADLDVLLGLYREVASELLFPAHIVDEQRETVMREMADKRLGNDIHAGLIAAIAPGSPTDLIDAQNSDDVPTASPDAVRALYQRLYRPENTTIVIVGDVDPDEIATLIDAQFGDWQGEGPAPEHAPVPTFYSGRIAPVSHSALRYAREGATFSLTMPYEPLTSRASQAEADLLDLLMMRVINNRLATGREAYPAGSYGFFIENGANNFRFLVMWDDFVPGRWREAAANLVQTACDIGQTGFTEAEWAAAKQSLIAELEQRAGRANEAANFDLALQLANAATLDRDLLPPGEMLAVARSLLPGLDASEGRKWWLDQRAQGSRHLRVTSADLASQTNANAAIRKAINDAVSEEACQIPH
ncbi:MULTISPECIES: M16 family metallopeptidase [Citromicrobium]|uniref:M16 family metallopeptidase n=1 Tax=Citromicrobium TaxID=72173 RepID=UPI0012E1F33B|nr:MULTISPECIES: pitrilysin family protein [Citromicrobium]